MFQMALDNSLMAEIYPYGGLWAYLKFHFIDGMLKQSIMTLDKTRVDYDSKEKPAGKVFKGSGLEGKDLAERMKCFGIGTEVVETTEETQEQRIEKISIELEKE